MVTKTGMSRLSSVEEAIMQSLNDAAKATEKQSAIIIIIFSKTNCSQLKAVMPPQKKNVNPIWFKTCDLSNNAI